MHTCNRCNKSLPDDAFKFVNGYRNKQCKACHNDVRRARMQASPEARAKRSAENRAYWDRNPGKLREQNIRAAYGITVEEYDEIMAKPCAICGAESKHLDHNHETKQIRGPLCQGCNLALGHLKDDPWRAEQAAIYLRKWSQEGDQL